MSKNFELYKEEVDIPTNEEEDDYILINIDMSTFTKEEIEEDKLIDLIDIEN